MPLFYVGERLKSAFVDGSIYWLEVDSYHQTQKILALDLHTEEFRSVRTPPRFCSFAYGAWMMQKKKHGASLTLFLYPLPRVAVTYLDVVTGGIGACH